MLTTLQSYLQADYTKFTWSYIKKKDSIVKNKTLSVATYINFKIVCHNFQCHIKKASIKICLGLGFFVIFFASMQVFCNDTSRQSLHWIEFDIHDEGEASNVSVKFVCLRVVGFSYDNH